MLHPIIEHDVVIVGGGLVGAMLACALADSGLNIAVVEQQTLALPTLTKAFDARVSAINRATQQIFDALGLWEPMAAQRVAPLRRMQVWDANSKGHIDFDCQELGEPHLGHIVEHQVMQHALYQRLQQAETVKFYSAVKPAAFYQGTEQHLLVLADGRQLTSPLVVAADGSHSWLRTQAGINVVEKPYQHTAIVATIKTERAHQFTARQRFLPAGPLAFLPLPEAQTCSIVWSTTPTQAQRLLQLDELAFQAALEQASASCLGKITASSNRMAFSLVRRHAQCYVKPGIALIGDSAHTIHPLAGQGFNLGVMDAACLAEVIIDAKQRGERMAALRTLRRYERWRKEDVVTLLATMDGFKHLFGSQLKPLQLLRGLGLNLAQRFNPLKQRLMRRAMGFNGDLPRLAKPSVLQPLEGVFNIKNN